MNRKIKAFFRRCSALVVSGIMSVSAVSMLSVTARADFTDEIAELEEERNVKERIEKELEARNREYEPEDEE